LAKASSDEIKQQLQEAIDYGKSHLQSKTLEESILKDWRLEYPNARGFNDRNSNSVRNREGFNRDSSVNNRYQQQNRSQQNRGGQQQYANRDGADRGSSPNNRYQKQNFN
jgi:hypothetical protein